VAILAAALVVWPRWFPAIPPWAATLAELPGPAGGWWFDETPWYAPLVREEIVTRAVAPPDLSSRTQLKRLGEQFLTRADAGTPDTLTELERVTRDVLESRAGREADVVRQLLNLDKQQQLTRDDLRKEYRLLIPRLGDPTTATAYHLRALLHQSCSAPQAAAADFDQALAMYREQDSPLFAWCCCDRARLDFESLDDPGSAADRLRSTAIPATRSALLAIDAHCLTATVFGAWKGQFHEAAQALAAAHQIARKADLGTTHPFHGLIVETEARIAADDWKLKKAKTLYGQACTIRQSLADGGYRRGWRKIYENRQGLATVEHFLGNQAQSQRLFGQLLGDLERSLGPSLVTMVPQREQAELRAMRPMLAECRGDAFLFGPDYDYERAGQAFRAALDYAAEDAVDVAVRWPAIVSLRYKYAVTLALDRRDDEAARAVDDADAALENHIAPAARSEILLGPPDAIGLPAPHNQIVRGYRALAKACPLLKSGDDAERFRARQSLERLLDETAVGRHTLDMVLLAAQLLMESPACETDRLVRTIKYVRDLTEQFATQREEEDVCGYFRRTAMIAHSAAEYVRNTDDMTAAEVSESIAYLERAHVVRGSAMSPAPAFAATPARLHALAVGVSVYENHSQEDPLNLKSADDDARALHAAFGHLLREGPDGTKNRVGIYLPSPLSRVLVNQEATCRGLWRFVDELRRLPSVDRQSDFVIVSLSGHGVLDEDGVLFFLPYDYATGNLLSTAVEIEELKNRLRMLGTHVLLILDMCHSGAAARSPESGLVRFKATSEDVRAALRKMAESEKSLAVLVAGRAREQAGESHAFGGHGALTAAVLEFLRQEPFPIATKDNSPAVDVTRHLSDGPLTLHDLRRYVTDRMEQFPFIKQTPDLFVSGPTGGDYRLNDVPLRFAAGAE
jgi:tetratricopeptide (TPR) repeat protein